MCGVAGRSTRSRAIELLRPRGLRELMLGPIVLTVVNCAGPPQQSNDRDGGASSISGRATDTLPIRRLTSEVHGMFSMSSGVRDRRESVVRDSVQWRSLWTELVGRRAATTPVPAVDFGREMIVFVSMGSRPTGGYAVTIERITRAPNALVVSAVYRSPGPRCGVGQAVSAPVDVVLVPRMDLPLRFVARDSTADCA
jgi:hypothetical protein